jgi:hypothetical protein
MGKSVFSSDRSEFMRKNDAFLDLLKGSMAMDIEVGIKMTAGTPVKTGDMKAETRHFRSETGGFRVETDKEYAAVQEAGQRLTGPGAPTQPFENYTTPGTSAGWFQRAIDAVLDNQANYVTRAAEAVGLD